MMRNKAYNLKHWSFSSSDRILPDANFWINVFGPAAAVGQPNKRVQAYSDALRQILALKVALFLDVLILSEFVNTLARLEYNTRFSPKYPNFKKFRNSSDFIPTARMIAQQCKKIERLSKRIDHPLQDWPFQELLNTFEKGREDFNDQLIIEQSKKHQFILLTDDGDMKSGGLTVLTANNRLLQACP